MPQVAASPRLLCFGLALLCGCSNAKQDARIATLEAKLAETTRIAEETNHAFNTYILEEENEKRRAEREKYCKAPEIIGFMDQIQSGLPSACNPIALSTTLTFLDKIPTICAHLDPKVGWSSLLKTRIGQIRKELSPDKLHASTRILLMVKPADDTEPSRDLALTLARQLKEQVVLKALPQPPPAKPGVPKPHEYQIMGPYLLPCELSEDIGQLYKKPYFRPIPGEPKLGKPDVAIFVVVSPC